MLGITEIGSPVKKGCLSACGTGGEVSVGCDEYLRAVLNGKINTPPPAFGVLLPNPDIHDPACRSAHNHFTYNKRMMTCMIIGIFFPGRVFERGVIITKIPAAYSPGFRIGVLPEVSFMLGMEGIADVYDAHENTGITPGDGVCFRYPEAPQGPSLRFLVQGKKVHADSIFRFSCKTDSILLCSSM
ncbi:MAG: hypothetical protein ACLFSE_05700, partial [Spirochaetia bacterium]